MRLLIENIGVLKKADINLNGLTVIAGENDTGKSTTGKVIFSIVKGIQKYEENLESKFQEELLIIIDQFYRKIQKIKDNNDNNITVLFFPPIFIDKILENKKNLDEFLEKYKQLIKKLNNENLEKEFEKLSQQIKNILLNNDEKELQKDALKRAFFSEFRNQLKLNNSKKGLIEIVEKNERVIRIEIKNEIILKELYNFSLDDVSLIKTPMILNFSDMIQGARSYFEENDLNDILHLRADVIYHSKDLINKLINSAKYGDNEIDEDLSKMLKFNFEYKDTTREFVYLKNNVPFSSLNVAAGIKSFGIIKLLLKGNYIRKNILLIIDEPEVHLHPKWQLEYAKLIIELVKRGVKVLVTSHSPYMIEALNIFAIKEKIDNNFYLAEGGKIKEQDTIENIFEKLVEPIKELKRYRLENI